MRAEEFIKEGYEGLRPAANVWAGPGVDHPNLFPGKDITGQRVYHVTNRLKAIVKSGGLKPKIDVTGENEYGRLSTPEHPFTPAIGIWFANKADWFGKYVLSWEILPTDKTAVAYATGAGKQPGTWTPNIQLNPVSMDRITVTDRKGNPIEL